MLTYPAYTQKRIITFHDNEACSEGVRKKVNGFDEVS